MAASTAATNLLRAATNQVHLKHWYVTVVLGMSVKCWR